MRHRAKNRQLGRTAEHRRALLANMATSLFLHGGIVTTVAKAKELRPMAEKLITLGKKGTLHARRQVLAVLYKESTAVRLFDVIAPRFTERPGGYTRVVKLGPRLGDGAEMAILELVGSEMKKKEKKKTDQAAKKG